MFIRVERTSSRLAIASYEWPSLFLSNHTSTNANSPHAVKTVHFRSETLLLHSYTFSDLCTRPTGIEAALLLSCAIVISLLYLSSVTCVQLKVRPPLRTNSAGLSSSVPSCLTSSMNSS